MIVELNEKELGLLKRVVNEAELSSGSWEEFKEHICSIFDGGKTPSGLGMTNCYCDVDDAKKVIVINPTGLYYVVVMKYRKGSIKVSAMDYKLKNTVYEYVVDGSFREMCEESVALAKNYILKLDS